MIGSPPKVKETNGHSLTIGVRIPFTHQILIGLGLGVAAGLFLGERASFFQYGVEAFVRLLQMTVLPYIMVSLIAGIGSLDASKAKRLFVRVGILTLVLWTLALGAVFLMPLAFPRVQNASFFSTTLVEERPPFDFVSLYIPSNPFHSLANSIVPAVVLFSSFLGVALIGIERKDRLIEVLAILERALAQANRFVVRLTPFGLCAIAALTVGTVDPEQLARVNVYLICYAAMALLLTFWVLPGLVACLSPIPVRRVLSATRDVLITAFMTGDLFLVLPILIDRSKELLHEYGLLEVEKGSPPDVIVPAFFNFPHAAKLLSLSFVLFAAWYSETVLSVTDHTRLAFAGIMSLMGSINVAIPFLLDLVRVPADTFQLFLATGVLNSRFGTLTSAMYMVTLALAGTVALSGKLRLSGARILRYILITLSAAAATIIFLSLSLRSIGAGTYDRDRMAMAMEFLHPSAVSAVILRDLPVRPGQTLDDGMSVLEAVRARGRLCVGYFDSMPPYSYFNTRGNLVGFDVEMAHALAGELGVALEFLPVPRERLTELIAAGLCDIAIGGIAVTTERAEQMDFSPPYLDETLAFVVRDERRTEFSSLENVRKGSFRIAVPNLPYYLQLAKREFRTATILPITNPEDFFTGRRAPADALALPAERGSFMTLLHPDFSVAVPHPLAIRIPLAYPVARHDLGMVRFLGTWIDLKRKDGTIQGLYDHWILGREARPPKPRWSVLRNVLHRVN